MRGQPASDASASCECSESLLAGDRSNALTDLCEKSQEYPHALGEAPPLGSGRFKSF